MQLKFCNQKTRRRDASLEEAATQSYFLNELGNVILKLGKSFLFFLKKRVLLRKDRKNLELEDLFSYLLYSEYNHCEIRFFVFFFKSRIWGKVAILNSYFLPVRCLQDDP